MKPPAFRYAAPTTSQEVAELLAEYGSDARVIAGGQSLVPLMNLRMIRPALLIDLNRCPELAYIERRGDEIALGPMTRQIDAMNSPLVRAHCPLVAQCLEWTGPVAVRSRATVGGTVAHADRVAELPAVAVALDATLVIASAAGRREVPASEFFLGDLSTVIEAHEFLRELRFPVSPPEAFCSFTEVSVRQEGVAVVGLAVHLVPAGRRIRRAALAAMGADSTPLRLRAAEDALTDQELRPDTIEAAVQAALGAVDPMPDIYASAAYRKHVIGTLLRRALQDAAWRTPHG